jgi:hypothetical protein
MILMEEEEQGEVDSSKVLIIDNTISEQKMVTPNPTGGKNPRNAYNEGEVEGLIVYLFVLFFRRRTSRNNRN